MGRRFEADLPGAESVTQVKPSGEQLVPMGIAAVDPHPGPTLLFRLNKAGFGFVGDVKSMCYQ